MVTTMSRNIQIAAIFTVLSSVCILAACGGGGGGGNGNGGGAINNPSPQPSPTLSPGLTDTMNVASGGTYNNFTYNAASNAAVVFSCGCSSQAGETTADGSGAVAIGPMATATPINMPNPTYTLVPGRNYVVIATTAANGEAWTIQFAGRNINRNKYLNPGQQSDVFTAAVALYIFYNSPLGETAFDDWNFNTISNWYSKLQSGPNASETTLLNYIASRSAANETLFPAAPSWNPGHAHDATMAADLTAVKASGDNAIPTPCPSAGCSGTPSP
jgi:hypothetical protein